jgi:hypothetical protein
MKLFALLKLGRRDRLRDDARRGRRVERDGGSAESLERDQLPDLGVPGHEQRAHGDANAEVRRVGADHHDAARQPVRDDASDQERRELRERPGGEGETDLRGGAAELEHRERDRDGARFVPKNEIARAANRYRKFRSPRTLTAKSSRLEKTT